MNAVRDQLHQRKIEINVPSDLKGDDRGKFLAKKLLDDIYLKDRIDAFKVQTKIEAVTTQAKVQSSLMINLQ